MDTKQTSDLKQPSPEPPINRVHYCQGTTKKGQSCLIRVNVNNRYCSRHAKLFKFPKPDECPICLDSSTTMPQPLSCGHWICRTCITKWRAECPICRASIQVTKREQRQIESIPVERNEAEDLTAQAISSILGISDQEAEENQLPGFMDVYVDETEDFNLFTSMILAHMNNMHNLFAR